jgi:hypothetical protein
MQTRHIYAHSKQIIGSRVGRRGGMNRVKGIFLPYLQSTILFSVEMDPLKISLWKLQIFR